MTAKLKTQRWNDVTIAELVFFERIGSTLSASSGGSMLQVALRAGIKYPYFHNTMGRLEGRTRFGRLLVDRTLVCLTREGEEVLAYARKVLSTYQMRPFQTGRVTLRIAATNRILTTLLASYLPSFVEKYRKESKQDIDIEILEANFERVLSWLETGEVELAFGGINPLSNTHPKLIAKSLRDDLRMILIAPKKGFGVFTARRQKDETKVSLKELVTTNTCLIRRDYRGEFRNLPPAGPGYSRIVVDNYSSVVSIVRAGTAVGLVINYGLPSDLLKFELLDANQSAQKFAMWSRKGIELSSAALSLNQAIGGTVRKRRTKKSD